MIDRTKKLSEHFTLAELTKTKFKTEDNNEPPLEAIENMVHLCQPWLEELRYHYNRRYVLTPTDDYHDSRHVEPIVINQGFRSYQVMRAMQEAGLKPSTTSNHMKGCAVDIRCMGSEHAIHLMDTLLCIADESHLNFDELYLERRAPIYWIHFAVKPEGNRRKVNFIIK